LRNAALVEIEVSVKLAEALTFPVISCRNFQILWFSWMCGPRAANCPPLL